MDTRVEASQVSICGIGAGELALSARWLTETGDPNCLAVVSACMQAGFATDGRMYRGYTGRYSWDGKMVSEWRFTPIGVADFFSKVDKKYQAMVFDVLDSTRHTVHRA